MQNKIFIKNHEALCEIEIEGIIGVPEEWQFDHPDQRIATYEGFREALQRITAIEEGEVVVHIRSTGGDVNDALLIYDALRATRAHITTRCYGYTASAATIIAQAASEGCREIAPEALYLIHNSICSTEGNAEELRARVELLEKTDERLAALYAERSGLDKESFRALMAENNGRGRWLSPDEAIAAGLADRTIPPARSSEKSPSEEPDKAAESAPEALKRSLAQGWKRLVEAVCSPSEELPTAEDRNILHFDPFESRSEQKPAPLRRNRKAPQPTTAAAREDPSLREPLYSANREAYAADAKSFRK